MDKTELLKILVNNSKVWVKDEKDQDKAMIYIDDFADELLKVINYNRCCESDTDQLTFECELCQDDGVMITGMDCTCDKAPNKS